MFHLKQCITAGSQEARAAIYLGRVGFAHQVAVLNEAGDDLQEKKESTFDLGYLVNTNQPGELFHGPFITRELNPTYNPNATISKRQRKAMVKELQRIEAGWGD